MGFLLAGTCVVGLFASMLSLFLLTIPAAGEGGLAGWRQTHERVYRNSLECSAAVALITLLILSLAAIWLFVR
jgi:hypothetical protein